jgi:hypothetical protein
LTLEEQWVANNGTAYTDRRFVDVLPSDFEMSSLQGIIDRSPPAMSAAAASPLRTVAQPTERIGTLAHSEDFSQPAEGHNGDSAHAGSEMPPIEDMPGMFTDILARTSNAANGHKPASFSWRGLARLLNELVKQELIALADRDAVMEEFGTMRDALRRGSMQQEDFDEEVQHLLAELPSPASR